MASKQLLKRSRLDNYRGDLMHRDTVPFDFSLPFKAIDPWLDIHRLEARADFRRDALTC